MNEKLLSLAFFSLSPCAVRLLFSVCLSSLCLNRNVINEDRRKTSIFAHLQFVCFLDADNQVEHHRVREDQVTVVTMPLEMAVEAAALHRSRHHQERQGRHRRLHLDQRPHRHVCRRQRPPHPCLPRLPVYQSSRVRGYFQRMTCASRRHGDS